MRVVTSSLLVLVLAAEAPAQFMSMGGFPGGGNMFSPYGTGGYGLGGKADMQQSGGYGSQSQDPRSSPYSFFGGFRNATRSRRSGAALAHGMPLSKRGGASGLAQLGLVDGKAAAAALPPELVAAMDAGPITEEQAHALVSALVAVDVQKLSKHGAPALDHRVARRTYAPTHDADVAALQAKLDELVPDPAGATPDLPPRTLDREAVKSWFDALDVSKDGSITFLEWRDRTGLGLPLFRHLDTGANGLIEFDEFARALVLDAAGSKRSVDPELLEWATTAPPKEGEAEDTRKADDLVPPQGLDELLERARSLIAGAALEQQAKQAEAAKGAAAGAKGAAGKTTAKPKASGDLFDLLRAGGKPKSKPAPKPRDPLPMPTPPDSGGH